MRFSDAILMGDVLRKRNHATWMDSDCGCAVGGALNAVGVSYEDFIKEWIVGESEAIIHVLVKRWAWITSAHTGRISGMFTDVCYGRTTLEALCDQVRAWEDELAAKGINVEQVTMAAELNQPARQIQSIQESSESLEQDVAK